MRRSTNPFDGLHRSRSSKLEKIELPDGCVHYRHIQSNSATEATVSASFSPDIRSPTSAFFTPDTSRTGSLASAASRLRRQTFPAIGAGVFAADHPVFEPPSSMAIPDLEFPLVEMEASPSGLHSAVNHSTQ